jgi:hypothetical protein
MSNEADQRVYSYMVMEVGLLIFLLTKPPRDVTIEAIINLEVA